MMTIESDFTMSTSKQSVVNLDALIIRSDLLAQQDGSTRETPVNDMFIDRLASDHPFWLTLRKPDFQRETCSWDPKQIKQLIENQLDNKLIPAVIMWRNPINELFVVDGAHRLSALIAWVNDDYGFGKLSQKFFGAHNIPKGQQDMDRETRNLINGTIKSYAELLRIAKEPTASALDKQRANAITNVSIQTQTLMSATVKDVADSFVRINQGGVKINSTEAAIIRKRGQPEGIAARAVLRAGTGYEYWKRCSPKDRAKIVELSKQIDQMLYEPESKEGKQVFSAIPMAGKRYASDGLGFIYHLIEVSSKLTKATSPPGNPHSKPHKMPKSELGETIIRYLGTIRDLLLIMFSKHASSLGMHPAVYCRSATGRFQPSAFYAQVQLVQHLESIPEGFHKFTEVRNEFEEFLVKNKTVINEIVRGKGSSLKSLKTLTSFYLKVYNGLRGGQHSDDIWKTITEDKELKKYLTLKQVEGEGDLSEAARSAMTMHSELSTAARCPECQARMHLLAITSGHKRARSEGGSSHSSNLGPMHPFCNSGVEERRRAKEKASSAKQP